MQTYLSTSYMSKFALLEEAHQRQQISLFLTH